MHSWLYPVFLQTVNKSQERTRLCQLVRLGLTLMLNTLQLVEFQLDIYIYIYSSEIQGPCTANGNEFVLLKVRNQITSFPSVTYVLIFKRKWLCFFQIPYFETV
jgi:hypothetical protein